MNQHPTIAAALAEQRRATLMAEAGTARLARAARNGGNGRPRRPVRWLSTDRRPGTSGARRGLARLISRARTPVLIEWAQSSTWLASDATATTPA